MNYLKLTIQCEPATMQSLIALYSQFENASFEELDNGFHIYIPKEDWMDDQEVIHHQIKSIYPHEIVIQDIIPENWNAIWEQNFKPVLIDEFCYLRADFHPPNPKVQFDLMINPKLAFGTGHHETTFMVIKAMQNFSFVQKSVFDFGCGTAVLAILAEMMGAKELLAIDYDSNAVENSIENIQLNNCHRIVVKQGSIEDQPKQKFDFLFANINRNVLLNSMPLFQDYLEEDGILLMSGILTQDLEIITKSIQSNQLQIIEQDSKGEWICLTIKKMP